MLLEQSMPLILLKLLQFEWDIILIFCYEPISARSPVCIGNAYFNSIPRNRIKSHGGGIYGITGSHKVSRLWLSSPSLLKAATWGKEESRLEGLLCHHGQALGQQRGCNC